MKVGPNFTNPSLTQIANLLLRSFTLSGVIPCAVSRPVDVPRQADARLPTEQPAKQDIICKPVSFPASCCAPSSELVSKQVLQDVGIAYCGLCSGHTHKHLLCGHSPYPCHKILCGNAYMVSSEARVVETHSDVSHSSTKVQSVRIHCLWLNFTCKWKLLRLKDARNVNSNAVKLLYVLLQSAMWPAGCTASPQGLCRTRIAAMSSQPYFRPVCRM